MRLCIRFVSSFIVHLHPFQDLTKHALIFDIARLFDVLECCSPAIIRPKILLQRLWKERLDWDVPAPQAIQDIWYYNVDREGSYDLCPGNPSLPQLSTLCKNIGLFK